MIRRVLITAGPTREYLDPVRYISNDSSGRMGTALARYAARTGASVTLIHGPISEAPVKKVRQIPVISAQEMFAAVREHYRNADIIICAAAVADFRPARFSKHKIKKSVSAPSRLPVLLVKNPDILAWLGRHKRPHQLVVGFALETENLLKNAHAKLKEKNADIIVANRPDNIGNRSASAVIITRSGLELTLKKSSKEAVAANIIKFAVNYQNS